MRRAAAIEHIDRLADGGLPETCLARTRGRPNMRRRDNVVELQEWMIRRDGFLLEHVKAGPSQSAGLKGFQQGNFVHQPATTGVDIHASLVGVIQGSHDVLGFRVTKRVTISGGWVTAAVGRTSNSQFRPPFLQAWESCPVNRGQRLLHKVVDEKKICVHMGERLSYRCAQPPRSIKID